MATKPAYDAHLKVAAKEIRNIMERHQVAGCINLASHSHAETCMYFPKWSLVRLTDDGGAVHIGLRAKEAERSSQSAWLLMALKDATVQQALALTEVAEKLIAAVEERGGEFTHTAFKDFVADKWDDVRDGQKQ